MSYRPPRWLPGAHLQTIYPALFLKRPLPPLTREVWTTPDDDVIAVDWLAGADDRPVLVLFHGLEGSSRSHYARAMLRHLHGLGWTGAAMHFRGCGGLDNRRPRSYHAGDVAEIDWMIQRVADRHPGQRLYAFGVSLGGNALLKWLGECPERAAGLLAAAAAASVPFDLLASGRTLDRGLNRLLYARHFLTTLKQKARRLRLDEATLRRIDTLYGFDEHVTAPVNGFAGAQDYWTRSSSRPWLRHIRVPTLLLHARNDPFMPASALPRPDELGAAVELRLLDHGGHAGFVSGRFPGHVDWLPQTVCQWLESAR